MIETNSFSITVLQYAYSEPSGLSGRSRQLLGPKEIDVTCNNCGARWKKLSAGVLAGAIGAVEVECPECQEEEMVPSRLFRPDSQGHKS